MAPKKYIFRFLAVASDQPIIYRLVKEYNLMVNIIKAIINPQREGMMVLEIDGSPEDYQRGMEFLRTLGVTVEPLGQAVSRNQDKCVQCGACSNLCSFGALYLERPSMEVKFDEEKCVVCMQCVKACPVKAMEVAF